MASLKFIDVTKTSIEVKVIVDSVGEDESPYTYRLFCRTDDEEQITKYDGKKSSDEDYTVTIGGLTRGTTYAFNLGVDYKDGTGNHWVYTEGVDPPTCTTEWLNAPTARVLSVDGTTVYIKISKWDSDSKTFEVYVGSYLKADGRVNDDTDRVELNFDRFNYTYDVKVYTYDKDNHKSMPFNFEIKTGLLKAWAWTSTEKSAFNNNGRTDTLTATRWRGFCTYMNGLSNAAKNARLTSKSYVIELKYFQDIRSGDVMGIDSFREAFWLLNYICEQAGVEYNYPRIRCFTNGRNYLWSLFYRCRKFNWTNCKFN